MLHHRQQTRRFPRVPSEHPVRIRVVGERRPETMTATRVISAGGCMLVSDRSLGFGSLVELHISLDGRLLRADARVAWERRGQEGAHEVGIEFPSITGRDRSALERFVAGKLAA